MKLNNSEKRLALELFTKWRGRDIPTVVTMAEAFKLTEGAIGVEYSDEKRNHAITLSLLSVKYARHLLREEKK
jgi:hypothetical protein